MNLKSKIGLGTVQFGLDYGISNESGKTSSVEVTEILTYAKAQGIDTIDTASAYGDAEKVLGGNDLSGFRIISKFMPPQKDETLSSHLHQSLKRLKQENIYGYLAHRPSVVLENPSLWKELQNLKKEGLVKKTGFSFNEPSELSKILQANFIPDLIQIPFNYFDRRFQKQIISLKEQGCEIHTRSAFLQGLFFINTDNLNSFFNEVKPVIKNLQDSVKNLSGSLLRFVAEQPFIDKVIVGVENINQLKTNLDTIETSEQLPWLKQIISDNILIPSGWPKN
jgi:aryl-alcohol dehydrogenase-like predicted oxidoreductase